MRFGRWPLKSDKWEIGVRWFRYDGMKVGLCFSVGRVSYLLQFETLWKRYDREMSYMDEQDGEK